MSSRFQPDDSVDEPLTARTKQVGALNLSRHFGDGAIGAYRALLGGCDANGQSSVIARVQGRPLMIWMSSSVL